jgi:hypothetical protein
MRRPGRRGEEGETLVALLKLSGNAAYATF